MALRSTFNYGRRWWRSATELFPIKLFPFGGSRRSTFYANVCADFCMMGVIGVYANVFNFCMMSADFGFK